MNILLLGSGGREHALAWKLAQSRLLDGGGVLYAAPGNPGIAQCAEQVELDLADHDAVTSFCNEFSVGLVVVGPEGPLVAGLADDLRAAGLAVFGPSKAAAQLEGSKGFTKDLCEAAGIPTAGYVRTTALSQAVATLARFAPPYVLKADGLAAGKGVVIAATSAEAESALAAMFAEAGAEVVIEEFMDGEEVSFFALTDGATIVPFGSAQDHKRVGEGDTGPNTGGMGAYSPAPVLTPELRGEVMSRILAPTVRALADAGTPYSGVLYAGLMLTEAGPKLVEYNCRFGDPECQVLMPRLESDLGEYLLACAENRLAQMERPRFSQATALTVVMAADGYPGVPERGGRIGGIEAAEATGAKIFHASTAIFGGQLVADGGRVLGITATGESIAEAQARAYTAIAALDFPGGFCRRDIGYREIARQRPHSPGPPIDAGR
ncbi:MAG: phosphoribosylamine--glycine ligase [Croceibacterium sp.]